LDASVRWRLIVASAVILAVVAPFGYMLGQAVQHAPGTGSPPRSLTGLEIPYTIFTFLVGYSFGPSVRDIQDHGSLAAVLAQPIQSAVAAMALLAVATMVIRLRNRTAIALGLLLILPIIATWLGSAITGKAYNVRYTLPGIIGFVGLVAIGITSLPDRRRTVAVILVTGLFLWADAQWFFAPRYWKEDSRSAVAWLARRLPPGSTVAIAPGYQKGVLTYYASRSGVDLNFDSLPEAARSVGSPLPEALLVTRLHHLPYWKELVNSLEPGATSLPHATELIGYRVFLAPK